MKTNPDGSQRFKARLVIKGYEQTDIGETFAPVAKLASLRMILALAALNGWEIDHMDMVTAFLNPPLMMISTWPCLRALTGLTPANQLV